MSKWKLKPPDSFPKEYRLAVEHCMHGLTAFDTHQSAAIFAGYSLAEAEYHADKFRCWRWCIRQYPLHDLHTIERDFNIKLRRVCRHGLYELTVTIQPKLSNDPLLAALEKDSSEDFAEIR